MNGFTPRSLKSSHIHFTGDIHVQSMQRQSGRLMIGSETLQSAGVPTQSQIM